MKCHYIFANDIDEARLLVTINKGFMPIEYAQKEIHQNNHIQSIPLYRHHKQLQRNYCAFWKKDKSHYYIEEFADMLRNKMRENHHE